QFLHNQSALLLKARLLFRRNTVVTSVPFHVTGPRLKPRASGGFNEPASLRRGDGARRDRSVAGDGAGRRSGRRLRRP
ncbi:MAG: DNA-binding protein, partial [Actinomycetota bacterium]|nr:DNA-binding protein [Actinomycetota bacterium]